MVKPPTFTQDAAAAAAAHDGAPQGASGAIASARRQAVTWSARASVVVDCEGNVVHMSDGAERFFPLAANASVRELAASLYPALWTELRAAMPMAFKARKSVAARPVSMMLDGRTVYINMVLKPVAQPITGRTCVLLTFDEVDELAPASGADDGAHVGPAAQSAGPAGQPDESETTPSDRALPDQFLAVMSHELKHPLNLIQLNAELLSRMSAVRALPAGLRAVQSIQRAVMNQVRIIDDLLDLSCAHTARLGLNRTMIDLCATVQSMVDNLRPAADMTGVVLDDSGAQGEPIHVHADAIRVEQIVWNLLDNAISFTSPGGRVSVAVQREGAMARLDVSDTGEGMEPALIAKVFDVVSQAEVRHHGRIRNGLGIGLGIVKQLAQAHGGRVEAASAGPGDGSRFTVWLPLNASEPNRDGAGATPAGGRLQGIKILVVDDSEEILETFEMLLDMEGAQVATANCGARAIEAIANEGFDLIISDIGMADMDGYRLLQTLRERFPSLRIPAVALTGYGGKDDVDKALQAGFVSHLSKPVTMEALLNTVTALVHKNH